MKPVTHTRHLAELLELNDRWLADYPDLSAAAEAEARRLLTLHGVPDQDVQHVYWHRFENAQSSPRAFSGWVHSGPPVQSLSLPQLVLQRFPSADQDRMDQLDMMSGFYTVGAEAGHYDEHHELRLLPSQLGADFWEAAFADTYQARLRDFWRTRTSGFIALSRSSTLVAIDQARQQGTLSDAQLITLQRAFANGLSEDLSTAALAAERPVAADLKVTAVSLRATHSRDLLRVMEPEGAQYLYMPNGANVVQRFEDAEALETWLQRYAATPQGLAELQSHFDPDDERAREVLAQLAKGSLATGWLGGEALPATKDPFAWLAERAAAEMYRHADLALTSNHRLRKEAAVAFLSTFAQLATQLAPLGWPIALSAVASASTAMGLDIDKAIQARSPAERKAAIGAAIAEGVTALFNLPLLSASPVNDLPWEVIEDEPLVVPRPPALPPSPISQWPLNTRGMIEQTDFELVFAVQEVERHSAAAGSEPALAATRRFTRLPRMIEGACVRVFGNAEGALSFAKSHFDGPFELFRIQAQGIRVASLRLNLRLNRVNTLALLGQEDRLLTPEELGDFAEGAWLDHEAHVAMADLSPARLRLLSPFTREPWAPPALRVLQGVHCQLLGRGVASSYLITVEDALRVVRFDPLNDCWRSTTGTGFRYNAAANMFEPSSAQPAIQPSAQEIEAATAELGMPANYPWRIPPVPRQGRVALPRNIHSVWLGRRLPDHFVNNVIANAVLAAEGSAPFDYHLYLSIEDPLDQALTLTDLATAPTNLHIHLLENTPFFRAFRQTPYYAQYKAATEGSGINYASAADVLRYQLLDYHGGLYMDIDDTLYGSTVSGGHFGELDWSIVPGRLMLNGLVNESRLGLHFRFNTSNFAALPDTPVLKAISQESHQRFLANRDLYFQRPYENTDSRDTVTAYVRRISHVTGPGVFNDVLMRDVPELRQFRAVTRIATELSIPPSELAALYREIRQHAREYSPLAWRIQIGSTSSWLHTR